MTNTAIFDPDPTIPDDEKEVTSSVTVSGVQMNKWGQFNGTTNKIDWTITVNAGELNIVGATLTDDMFAALSENNFTIEPSTGFSFTKDGEQKITGITFSAVADGKNTQAYTIKYSTDVTTNDDGSTSAVTNTATLSPGSGVAGNPIGSTSTVKPDELQLTKSGSYDSNNQKINWTIDVNSSKLNIAGAVLTDDMFSQLTSSDIRIQYDDTWGQDATSTEYSVATDASGKISSITFNAIADGKNNNHYVITYSTSALQEWNEKIVHNEAKLTLDGKDVPSDTDVTVPASGSIAKSAGTGEITGTTMTIPWTVTLTVPKDGLPAGTTIVDDVTKNQWSNTNTNQWMTRTQIVKWATNLTWTNDNGNSVGGNNTYTVPPEQVTFLASDGKTYTYKQISEYKAPAEGEGVNYEALTYTLFTIHFPNGLTPPEGATKLTFTYSTTVNLTQTTDGQNKFYNYVNAGGKETDAEYTYYKPCVVKTDGNGSTSETTVSNAGELTWKVKATVGQGNTKLTITDILPEGVTLDSLQLTGWNNMSVVLSVAENGSITGTDNTKRYNITGSYGPQFVPEGEGTVTRDVITLEITPKTENDAIQTGAEFTLTINCKVANASSQSGTLTLTNKAEMRLDNQTAADTPISSSEQTQKWTYDRQVVDKSGSWDNDNRIMNYTVILNPDGKDLVEGVDTLTLVDTMTYSNQVTLYWPHSGTYDIDATLIQSSVKLHEAHYDEAAGIWIAGQEVTGWSWVYDTKVENQTSETNTITATGIPDEKCLMFRYSYRVTSNIPEEVILSNGTKYNPTFNIWLNNKAALQGTGHSDDYSSSNWKWEHSSSSAGVTTDKSYTFYKVEAGNYNVSLAGATFSVYKYDNGSYGETAVKTYTTDSSGSFQITRQEKDASGNVTFAYDTNTLYKVVETAAPEGYWMPDVVNTYYFYFSSAEDTDHTLPQDRPADAVDLSSEAKTVYVENVKNTTEITVKKVWMDANGNDETASHASDTIVLNLYQRVGKGSSSGGVAGSGERAEVTATAKDGVNAESKITADAITIGSKIRIKVALTYAIPSDWTWRPAVNVTGTEDETITGWVLADSSASEHSTYTYEGIVTGNVSISMSDESEGNIASITVTTLSQATTPTEPDSGGETTTEAVYKTITLPDSDGNWSHTFTGLLLKGLDKDNNTVSYYYYFQEAEVPDGYSVSYSNGSTGVQSGTVTVTNQKLPDTTSVTVRKVWKDSGDQPIDGASDSLPASIQVYLTRTAGETTERVGSDGVIGDSAAPYEVTKADGWTLTVDNLPWTDSNGNSYIYSFEEVAVEGYDSAVTSNGTTITITNTQTTTPSDTSLTVEKKWANADGSTMADHQYSVQLQLHQALNGTKVENPTWGMDIVPTITLPTRDGAWSYTWQNLPDGYQYYVTEEWVHLGDSKDEQKYNFACFYWGGNGENAEHAVDVNSTITMTNELLGPGRRPTKVTAKKVWKQGEEQVSPGADPVTLQLYQVKHTPTPTGITVLEGKKQEKNGELTILNGCNLDDPSLFLRVTIDVTDGRYQNYDGGALCDSRWKAYNDLFIKSSATLGHNYRYFSLTELKDVANGLVLNYWGGGYSSLVCAEVVQVTASTTAEAVAVEPAVELNAKNDWRAEWTGLPTVEESTGEYYTYYVVETAVDGYTTTYQVGGKTYTTASDAAVDPYGSITVTNTKQPETTSITVKKEWKDSSGNNLTTLPTTGISFTLYRIENSEKPQQTVIAAPADVQTGTVVQTVTIGPGADANSWTASVSDLPTMGTSNETVVYYTYYVVETAVEGYDTTYSVNADTITITNKEKVEEKTSITVKKQWVNTSGATDPITFDLYRIESTTPPTEQTVAALADNETEVTVTFEHKNGGTSAVDVNGASVGGSVEITIVANYAQAATWSDWQFGTAFAIEGATPPATTPTWTADNSANTATLKFVVTDVTSSVTINIACGNGGLNDYSMLSAVAVGGSSTPSEEPGAVYQKDLTISSANNWSTTVSDLPLTDTNEAGQTVYYTYYVKETTSGYDVTYSNNNGITTGTITITNTATSTPTNLTVTKVWQNSNGNALSDTSGLSAEVTLYRMENNVGTVVSGEGITNPVKLAANSENGLSYSWQNLPAGTYYVVEESVPDGFNVTYSVTDGDEKTTASDACANEWCHHRH